MMIWIYEVYDFACLYKNTHIVESQGMEYMHALIDDFACLVTCTIFIPVITSEFEDKVFWENVENDV